MRSRLVRCGCQVERELTRNEAFASDDVGYLWSCEKMAEIGPIPTSAESGRRASLLSLFLAPRPTPPVLEWNMSLYPVFTLSY